jgi:hypothetical protein
MRYGVMARRRAYAALLAVATSLLLACASGASAETFKVSTAPQFAEAVSKANANGTANTIVLAAGGYVLSTTAVLTNTGGLQTIEGATSFPGATLNGSGIEPFPSEILAVRTNVKAKLKNLSLTGGGGGATPAIDNAGTLEVEGSLIGGNSGAGIHVEPSATATIRNSTLSDGLDLGLVSSGTTSFFNSTIAFNANGGVDNKNTLNLTNTIVAENKGSGDCVTKGATASDHTLDSDGSCGVGELSKTNPQLAKLANNGGPTSTHALERTSPAIDAADKAACPTIDQRGFHRPDLPATACDIGAYEFYPPPHWYENHVALGPQSGGPGEEGEDTLMWGKSVLTDAGAGIGTAECLTEWGGDVFNPEGASVSAGPGETKIDAFAAYDCTSTVCEATDKSKLSVEPEGLGVAVNGAKEAVSLEWEGKLAEPQPGLVRLKLGNAKPGSPTQIKWHVVCPETTVSGGSYNKKWKGELAPEIENGTAIGSAPTKLTFNSGELEVESTLEGKVTNKLKLMGYEGGEIVSTKTP